MDDSAARVPDPREEIRLNRREIERLREVAGDVREEVTFVQRKLDERDEQLREARAQGPQRVEQLERSNQELLEKVHRLEPEVRELRHRREQAERQLERLKNRRLVSLALSLARLFRPLFLLVRALRSPKPAPPPPTVRPPDPELGEEDRTRVAAIALERIIRDTVEQPRRAQGPSISIVVLNRDGQHHLRRLMPGLERTAYRSFDVTVVDNDSSDGSVAYLDRLRPPFPLQVVRNDHNASFAAGNGQGVAASGGELVLLMNNDVEPVTEGWLAHMVETLRAHDAAAVGARLIYPHRPGLDDNVGDDVHPDLTLQHRGIHFAHGDDGIPLPRNLGTGEDPLRSSATAVAEVPAVTAACVLVRRDAYEQVGGLCNDYRYGTEDVDLCLRLRAAGHRVVYDGQAVLWHHEFGTQNQEGREFKARNRRHNRQAFIGHWGARLHRQVLLDRLRADRVWSMEPLRVAVVGEHRDGGPGWEALERLDWEVHLGARPEVLDAAYDVAIVTDPTVDRYAIAPTVLTVGYVAAGTATRWAGQRWFDDLDVVVTEEQADATLLRRRRAKHVQPRTGALDLADDLRQLLIDWVSSTRFALLISTPSREDAESWGDTHYARGLQRWLERAGHPTEVVLRDGIDAPWSARADVALLLLGLSEHEPRPGQLSVLWNISHPELATRELVSRFDLAFVASQRLAAALADDLDLPVVPLHQATDPDRFHPTDGGPHHELLFVANSRRERRPIVDALTPSPFDLAIYGKDWFPELADPDDVRGELVPNEELPAWYAAADVVLNDHWPEMREHGYISNRLYDVLAAGGFVVSDDVAGLEEEFDGAVATYRDRPDLLATIGRFLADPEARREHAERGRRAVLARHTFEHRVAAILEVLQPMLAERATSLESARAVAGREVRLRAG